MLESAVLYYPPFPKRVSDIYLTLYLGVFDVCRRRPSPLFRRINLLLNPSDANPHHRKQPEPARHVAVAWGALWAETAS